MVAPFIPYLSIDTQAVRLLGTSGWDTPVISRDKSFAGGWFAAPNPRGWQIFSEKFAKSYRSPPPRLASLANDAMVIAGALAAEPRGSRYSAANLTRASGFTGIDGPFRLLPNGLVERELGHHRGPAGRPSHDRGVAEPARATADQRAHRAALSVQSVDPIRPPIPA